MDYHYGFRIGDSRCRKCSCLIPSCQEYCRECETRIIKDKIEEVEKMEEK